MIGVDGENEKQLTDNSSDDEYPFPFAQFNGGF
jgi:hypothetical protein